MTASRCRTCPHVRRNESEHEYWQGRFQVLCSMLSDARVALADAGRTDMADEIKIELESIRKAGFRW